MSPDCTNQRWRKALCIVEATVAKVRGITEKFISKWGDKSHDPVSMLYQFFSETRCSTIRKKSILFGKTMVPRCRCRTARMNCIYSITSKSSTVKQGLLFLKRSQPLGQHFFMLPLVDVKANKYTLEGNFYFSLRKSLYLYYD